MKQSKGFSVLDLTYIALFAVLLTLCSWISIPTIVPFTLQTLGVMLSAALLGWKRGFAVVFVYLLLGLVGLPVFSGFQAGLGILAGPSGGYMIGFLFTALIVGCFGQWGKDWLLLLGMFLGIVICYAFGTAWFMLVYSHDGGSIGLGAALLSCVIPFVLPDLTKIALAFLLTKRLRKFLR